jgi:hemolysin D
MSRPPEAAFLPAAIEVEQGAPSPLGRAIVWLIVAFVVAGLAWAFLGRVDIVAVAQGRIIPSGHSKPVQALEIGAVSAIHVAEGDLVETGDLLLELDARRAEADLARRLDERDTAAREAERCRHLADALDAGAPPGEPFADSEDPVLRQLWQEFSDRLRLLEREHERQQAEYDSALRQLAKLQAVMPLVARQAGDHKKLAEQKLMPEQQYLQTEQQRLELAHDLRTQQALVEAGLAAMAETEARMRLVRSEFQRQNEERLQAAEQSLAALEQELRKARTNLEARSIRAPVDGVVQQLAVHSRGAIVTPAQTLMKIVPRDERLEIEAVVENKDIGFVTVGQAVEVKVDTFPFTRYGTLAGRVSKLSADAVSDEQRGLVYKMRVSLERAVMQIEGRELALVPGMAVSVEAKTGTRRLIEFVLSPLLRHVAEAARER